MSGPTPGEWTWLPDDGQFIVDSRHHIVAEIPCTGGNPADGLAVAAVPNMVAALLRWSCPGCGGKGSHLLYGPGARAAREPGYHNPRQKLVCCRKCAGSGLDPRAAAALAAAGIQPPRLFEEPPRAGSRAAPASGPRGAT